MDLAHVWGGDLLLGPTGGLALADGPELTKQRVLRRLLTAPGEYSWHPEYGAGLAALIGSPAHPDVIAAIVRTQLALEDAVARVPEPQVSVAAGADGTVVLTVAYADAATGAPQLLTLPLGG